MASVRALVNWKEYNQIKSILSVLVVHNTDYSTIAYVKMNKEQYSLNK